MWDHHIGNYMEGHGVDRALITPFGVGIPETEYSLTPPLTNPPNLEDPLTPPPPRSYEAPLLGGGGGLAKRGLENIPRQLGILPYTLFVPGSFWVDS